MNFITKIILLITLSLPLALQTGCTLSTQVGAAEPVGLPQLKNSPNECYFLDDFMPVPDNLVTGKNGSLNLRYYTYKSANYKEWFIKDVMLSFYSKDGQCWSLFEEYFIAR